jgi:hypothetical protein
MPWVEFEPTTMVFERAKPVQALDRGATVIGKNTKLYTQIWTVTNLCSFIPWRDFRERQCSHLVTVISYMDVNESMQ